MKRNPDVIALIVICLLLPDFPHSLQRGATALGLALPKVERVCAEGPRRLAQALEDLLDEVKLRLPEAPDCADSDQLNAGFRSPRP